MSANRGDEAPVLRIFLWTGGFLFLGEGISSGEHVHQALQVGVGLDGPTRYRLDGGWKQVPGVVVDTDVLHGFDGVTGRHAALWVDAHTTAAARLRSLHLDGRTWTALPAPLARTVGDELAPCFDPSVGCEQATRRFRAALEALVGDVPTDTSAVDERLVAVLERLRRLDEPTPPARELARLAHLSESRLQHLFREQVGLPIRRYALWQRLLEAGRLMADGSSVSHAAVHAGFADAAHLSREWRRMNGQTPTSLGELHGFVTVCDDPGSRR